MSDGMQVPDPNSGGVDRSATTVPLKYKSFTRIFSFSVPSQIFYADNFFWWASSVEQLWECVSFVRECYMCDDFFPLHFFTHSLLTASQFTHNIVSHAALLTLSIEKPHQGRHFWPRSIIINLCVVNNAKITSLLRFA